MSKEAMKLALEAFSVIAISDNLDWIRHKAEQQCTALHEALAEQPAQQEPVAWMTKDGEIYKHECWPEHEARPLVFGDTSPPAQRTWVGLTDEEKQEWIDAMPYDPEPRHCMILVNVIEAKLKEKNT